MRVWAFLRQSQASKLFGLEEHESNNQSVDAEEDVPDETKKRAGMIARQEGRKKLTCPPRMRKSME
jgi:hypothetical protein